MSALAYTRVQRVPRRALRLSMQTIDRHGPSINSAEDRTPHDPSFGICMRLASRSTYSGSGLCDPLNAFCVTVATSCELVAIVDRDGQGINSAGARTPHEPLSLVLMSATWLVGCVSFGCAGCLLPSYAPPMGKGWCGSCASGLLSCVSCCSSIEFVVAVVGAPIYHVDVHIHFLVVGGDATNPSAAGCTV